MSLGKKLLYSGLGWAMGGPIGAILGYAFASFSDQMQNQSGQRTAYRRGRMPKTRAGDFMASLLVLLAAVMKADNKLRCSELDYIKRFLRNQFGNEDAKNYLILYRKILKQEYSLHQVCMQIQRSMDHPSRLELMHILFGLSVADGQTHSREIDVIEQIARYLNINNNDFASIKAMFIKSASSSYEILGIEPTATNNEVKKAFRKIAKKYHPDKVMHLGKELRESAEDKFKAVNKAYHEIKRERGMK